MYFRRTDMIVHIQIDSTFAIYVNKFRKLVKLKEVGRINLCGLMNKSLCMANSYIYQYVETSFNLNPIIHLYLI